MDTLTAYMSENGLTQSAVAKGAGCSQALVSKWLRRERKISGAHAARLEAWSGGKLSAVDLSEEAREISTVLQGHASDKCDFSHTLPE